jgi:hypothetical protein
MSNHRNVTAMSGADEKMRAVLEQIAFDCRRRDVTFIQLMLECRLLPLLLAGQAMRDWRFGSTLKSKSLAAVRADYDAALAAAQGQPEKESGR